MEGCLVCRDSLSCRLCDAGYFLLNSACFSCSSAIAGCVLCSSSTVCTVCEGTLTLSNRACVVVSVEASPSRTYSELSLKSRYEDAFTLSHTLLVRSGFFSHSEVDLYSATQISYLMQGGATLLLSITGYKWESSFTSIVFYTNNPFDFEIIGGDLSAMQLIDIRVLAEKTRDSRLLSRTTNFNFDADFQLSMGEATLLEILPSATHGGNLQLSYNINQPEFLASTLQVRSYPYHFFGYFLCLYLLVFYFFKGVVLDSKNWDKGQIMAHVLLLKAPALAVYPSYAELIDYCAGFMAADLPWFDFFSALLADPTDSTPLPYLLFYDSLSLASTYLLALMVICTIAVVLGISAYLFDSARPTLKNIGLFLYSYFLAGLGLAAVICVQGAFLNPIDEFTVHSSFYLLGIILYVILVAEGFWSTFRARHNLFKLRVLVKVTLLSLLHLSPLYLFSAVLAFEIFFLYLQSRLTPRLHPNIWLTANILPNLALLTLVCFSQSLLSLYLASGLAAAALVCDLWISCR
jgi:hypothetical protein